MSLNVITDEKLANFKWSMFMVNACREEEDWSYMKKCMREDLGLIFPDDEELEMSNEVC